MLVNDKRVDLQAIIIHEFSNSWKTFSEHASNSDGWNFKFAILETLE